MAPNDTSSYEAKLHFESSHTRVLEAVPNGRKVLDIGCADGYLAGELKKKSCHVTGIDKYAGPVSSQLDAFYEADLNTCPLPIDAGRYDCLLMLDIIEHLLNPESFVEQIANSLANNKDTEVIATTGNVAFVAIRLMLVFGVFNYGERGILDRTHTRLFTFSSFQKLFRDAGFEVIESDGIPAPFPFVLGTNALATLMIRLNKLLIRLFRGLFSYQIYLRLRLR